MKTIKKTFLAALMLTGLMGVMGASAAPQNDVEEIVETTPAQPYTIYKYVPNWYVQGQFGNQYTLGEISFSELCSPTAQLAVGYNFSPTFGMRLAVSSWKSRAGLELDNKKYKWDWRYVAPSIEVNTSLTNLICGFNPKRLVNVGLFAGIGLNYGFKNDEAVAVNSYIANNVMNDPSYVALGKLWDGEHWRLLGRAGITLDFRISDHVSAGLEINANVLNDHYNSKRAGNADWYFNGLVGIKYTFGKTYKEVRVIPYTPDPIIQEKIVERVVEKFVEPAPVVQDYTLQRDVFFTINSRTITSPEMAKVKEVADFMKSHPETKVIITGYADKGTGNARINERLSRQRAETVAKTLVDDFNIDPTRVTYYYKGDTVQPFVENDLNRVAICIVQQ